MHAALVKNEVTLVRDVRFCVRLKDRLTGLLGVRSLGEGRGVFIAPCNAIHTFFMRMSLDAVFLSRDLRVTRLVRGVRPWRMVLGGPAAWGVVEMEAGWLPREALREGDQVGLRPATPATENVLKSRPWRESS